ncbi:hypothetical protein QUF74_02315 [Candidatus Halobeggiatoa sp. HSG11]|nr:hypothetical protein [Candidatus Halobeggiatoa sp. HSG11]
MQLNLDFDKSPSKPVIWQWNELSTHVRAIILELAVFNSEGITNLSTQEARELDTWVKCTLNQVMKLTSKGWLDLRFDE